jgi:hypothetical protein
LGRNYETGKRKNGKQEEERKVENEVEGVK